MIQGVLYQMVEQSYDVCLLPKCLLRQMHTLLKGSQSLIVHIPIYNLSAFMLKHKGRLVPQEAINYVN